MMDTIVQGLEMCLFLQIHPMAPSSVITQQWWNSTSVTISWSRGTSICYHMYKLTVYPLLNTSAQVSYLTNSTSGTRSIEYITYKFCNLANYIEQSVKLMIEIILVVINCTGLLSD